MGNADSKQKLGEKVTAARKKLEEDSKIYSERAHEFNSRSTKMADYMIENISKCFKQRSPFSEPTLLTAWHSNPAKCEEIVLDSCSKVLSAPIIAEEWKWFQQYVFPSSIWMLKSTQKQNTFMYENLLKIAESFSDDIMESMDDIYGSLAYQKGWKDLMNIKKQDIILRQDDEQVGLLREDAITELLESKSNEDQDEDSQTFIDSHWCISSLLSTAKEINKEFQAHIKLVLSHYGDFKPGPLKNINRCQSKMENDYADEDFPKAAKLLDIVRCSVTFNSVKDLVKGYDGLMHHIQNSKGTLQVARVKNGFLNKDDRGYRDVKINVIYNSPINGMKMVCEIQLLLNNYLWEKKKIHKLYNVIRQKIYFQLVVSEEQKNEKEAKDLQLVPMFNFEESNVKKGKEWLLKCSVDSELNLLGVRAPKWFGCVSLNTKKIIFEQEVKGGKHHSHHWINVNGSKYLTVQTNENIIKMYKVSNNIFEEDKSMEISVAENKEIDLVEFDKDYQNVFLIVDKQFLEQRAMDDVKNVKMKMELQSKIGGSKDKQLALSNGGQYCGVAGGLRKNYFYFIDLKKQSQDKVTTSFESTYVHCFINGESKYVVIGDYNGKWEVWDMEKKAVHKVMEPFSQCVGCAVSTNNILAVASWDKSIKLFDVRNWEMFYSNTFKIDPYSLHLTSDTKYLTIGGQYGEKCIVWKIQ